MIDIIFFVIFIILIHFMVLGIILLYAIMIYEEKEDGIRTYEFEQYKNKFNR